MIHQQNLAKQAQHAEQLKEKVERIRQIIGNPAQVQIIRINRLLAEK